jgi:hypothetical protein
MKVLRVLYSAGQFRDRFFKIDQDLLLIIFICSLSVIIFQSHFMLYDRRRWTERKVAGRFALVPLEFLVDITLPPFAARISRVVADVWYCRRTGTWRREWERLKAEESNGKLPPSTCPGCSVPEP